MVSFFAKYDAPMVVLKVEEKEPVMYRETRD